MGAKSEAGGVGMRAARQEACAPFCSLASLFSVSACVRLAARARFAQTRCSGSWCRCRAIPGPTTRCRCRGQSSRAVCSSSRRSTTSSLRGGKEGARVAGAVYGEKKNKVTMLSVANRPSSPELGGVAQAGHGYQAALGEAVTTSTDARGDPLAPAPPHRKSEPPLPWELYSL